MIQMCPMRRFCSLAVYLEPPFRNGYAKAEFWQERSPRSTLGALFSQQNSLSITFAGQAPRKLIDESRGRLRNAPARPHRVDLSLNPAQELSVPSSRACHLPELVSISTLHGVQPTARGALQTGDPVDLKDAVRQYVASTYGPRAAEDCTDDLAEAEALRARVLDQPKATPGLRDALGKYYRVLCAMESRFPVSEAPGHVHVSFAWADAFTPSRRAQQTNIHFEKAAVAFNLAAAISQYALECDRRTEGGLTAAAKLFQEAAGGFAALRDTLALKVDVPRPVDITPECAAMLERLMMAQAAECVLDRAVAGGKQPATLARLAKQVAVFYDDTTRLLTAKPLADHFDRSWQAHAAAKSLLFHLEADLHNAAHLRGQDPLRGVASEIAQLVAAKVPLEAAKKEAKAASKELQDNVAEKEKAVRERLARAERENSMVYLQRIPSMTDLPPVVPACLVKPATPPELAGAGGDGSTEAMFKGVVPESTTRALSKYTDMVDSLIRRQADTLAAASDDARLRLREWELPESLAAMDPGGGGAAALPDALRVDLEKVEAAGGVPHLQALLAQVRDMRGVASTELDAAEAELAAEAREDEELRAHYGTRWRRPPSAQLTATLTDKAKGYRSNLNAAAEADAKLEVRVKEESPAFAALDAEAVAAGMPRLQSPMLSVDDMEPAAAVAALRQGLEGLATLSSQRAALEQALKERKAGDDVLPKLLGGAADTDALFKAELAKYDDLVKGVQENVAKQAQLLEAMAAANATFRRTHDFEGWSRGCEGAVATARSTAKGFTEVAANLSEGVRFYTSLQDAITALRQQVGDYCVTRKVQRDELLEELKKAAAAQEAAAQQQLAGMSLSAPPPPPQQQQQQGMYGPPSAYGAAASAGGPPPPPPQQQAYALQQQPQAPPQQYVQPQMAQWPPQGYSQPPMQQAPQQPPANWPPQGGYQQQPPPPPPDAYQQQPQYGGGYPAPQYPQYGGQQYQQPPPQQQQQQQQPPPQQQQQQGNPLSNFFGFGRP